MQILKIKFFLLLFLSTLVVQAQDSIAAPGKIVIDHKAYDKWRSIVTPEISESGKWITYEVNPQVGDGQLFLYNTETKQLDSFARGKNAVVIERGDGFLVYKKLPLYRLTRKAKLDKKKPDDMPKDTLVVINLTSKTVKQLGNIKSFSANNYSDFVMVQLGKEKPTVQILSKRQKRKRKKNPPVELKSESTALVIWWPQSNEQKKIKHVSEYFLSSKSDAAAFIIQEKGKNDSSYVYSNKLSADKKKFEKIHGINGWSKNITLNSTGINLAFLSSTDTNKNDKLYSLQLQEGNGAVTTVFDTTNKSIDKKLTVSENRKPGFSESGDKLYFGIAPIPVQAPKDTLTDDEKYNLDIWHWDDDRIQPEQLKQVENDKKETARVVYHLREKQFVQLENDSIRIPYIANKGEGNLHLAVCDKPYRKSQTWDTQYPKDYYIVNATTGEMKLVLEKKSHSVQLSHNEKYVIWYDPIKHDWFSKNLLTNENYIITASIDDNLFEDNNGLPELPDPFGIMGWSKNDEYVYIYSEYEAWKVHPENREKVVCLTKNKGGEYNTDLRNVRLNSDIDYIDESYLLFKSFNHHNKREGFWVYENNQLSMLIVDDYKFNFLGKSKNSKKIIYQKMDFQTYPDLLSNDLSFKSEVKISNANPQQKNYKWGTVELVKWKSYDNHDLEGLLYKPEDFDETKKYPMIVYFYEKNADQLHAYKSPFPSASVINFSEYVSNGYVIFVPDIVYKEGNPGKSAFNCIVSGTKSIVEKGFINEKKIGLQGQSWGGYQTAFLITQTDMYAAAMAGAPVTNMTSAYGGIRWESGLSRAFQYEKGQSRIGKTLWEDREAYIRNSPLFFADKVKTPLLMMNNDADGAVPWYQGIEFYIALRRMEKPVWLLNYNNEAHNLTKRPNKVDLSRRMLQFFNCYLKDEPMPQWMKEGVPAIQKTKLTGYELLKK